SEQRLLLSVALSLIASPVRNEQFFMQHCLFLCMNFPERCFSTKKREASASLFFTGFILSSFLLNPHCLLPIFQRLLKDPLHFLELLPLNLLILHRPTRNFSSKCILLHCLL